MTVQIRGESLSPNLNRIVINLLKYSLCAEYKVGKVFYSYNALTDKEKEIMTEVEYKELISYIERS